MSGLHSAFRGGGLYLNTTLDIKMTNYNFRLYGPSILQFIKVPTNTAFHKTALIIIVISLLCCGPAMLYVSSSHNPSVHLI